MSRKTIIDLNDDCLYEIFRHIKTNCEAEHKSQNSRFPVNYCDLIYFSTICERFVETFKDWNNHLYEELQIEFVFLENALDIEIYLVEKYDLLQTFPERDRNIYWTLYVNAIKENKYLEELVLKYRPNKYYPEHLDRVQALMNAINHKLSLQSLTINFHGYSFENILLLGEVSYLNLDVRMNAEDLVQLCRSNPYLEDLTFTNTELYGRFADIVPYCNQLERLELTMKTDIDASEYAALAKLPELKWLTLKGYHREGTLVKLFQGLKSMCLAELDIPDTLLTKEETQMVMEIKSLSDIRSGFTDMANLAHLSAPNEILIYAKPGQIILMEPLIHLLENSELQIKQENGPTVRIYFTKKLGTLIVDINDNDDKELWEYDLSNITNILTRTVQLLSLTGFVLKNGCNGCMLQAIFQSLASKQPQILKALLFSRSEEFTLEHASPLANIRSLDAIMCDFDNLKEILAMKVMQLNGIKEKANRVDHIETEECWIRVIHTDNIARLTLNMDRTFTVEVFAPLANLNNLNRLVINYDTEYQCFINLIKLINNLQELDIKYLDSEDLLEVSQVGGLKVLKFGVYGSSGINIHHLAALNHLESLTITKHPKGSLRMLLNALASKTDQVLQSFSIQQESLTSDEIVELVGINSLQRLQLGGIPNPFYEVETPLNLELIANLPNLKELNIHFDYKTKTVNSLLRALIVQSPQRLLSLSISSRDIRLICQLQELQSLECIVDRIEDITYIKTLRNLTELQIHNPEKTLMWVLLKELKVLPALQSLLLNDTRLDFLEVAEITKLNWLTRLRLGVAEKEFIFMLTELKNLEVLEITSEHFAEENESNFCVSLIESCPNLKSIYLHQYIDLLTMEFVDAIFKSIKTLRNPKIHSPLKLRGKWVCFDGYDNRDEYVKILYLNDAYIELEITDDEKGSIMRKTLMSRFPTFLHP